MAESLALLNPTPGGRESFCRVPSRHTIGVAIIVTNSYCAALPSRDSKWTPLHGTRQDSVLWEKCLQHLMFEVQCYRNLPRNEMIRLLESITKLDLGLSEQHAHTKHLVWVFCGHGTEGSVVCEDGKEVSERAIIDALCNNQSGTDVPKILFLDCCRGSGKDRGEVCSRGLPSLIEERGADPLSPCLKPLLGNTAVIRSTLPGIIAQEASGVGLGPLGQGEAKQGLFTSAMTRRLLSEQESLSDIVSMVNQDMIGVCPALVQRSHRASFQVAEIVSSLFAPIKLREQADCCKAISELGQPGVYPPHPPPHQATATPPVENNMFNAKHVFSDYFSKKNPHARIVEGAEVVRGGFFVYLIEVVFEGWVYSVRSGECRKKDDAKEDACWKMVAALRRNGVSSVPAPTTVPVVPKLPGPPVKVQRRQQAPPPTPPPVAVGGGVLGGPPPTCSAGSQVCSANTLTPCDVVARGQVPVKVEAVGKPYSKILHEFRDKYTSANGWDVMMMGEPQGSEGAFSCLLTLQFSDKFQLHSHNSTARSKKLAKEAACEYLVDALKRKGYLELK